MEPPFCPWAGCDAHGQYQPEGWWERAGYYHTDLFGQVQRFRCKLCGRGFSAQTFSLDYYAKRLLDYPRLAQLRGSCVGVRASGRVLGVDKKTIENKLMRLSHQAVAMQCLGLRKVHLREDLCADGFESFWVSQYFPNTVHLLAGSHSQFAYAYHGTTIRRSGRMSKQQKAHRARLERHFRADPRAVEWSFSRLVPVLTRLVHEAAHHPISFTTDEHRAYRRALQADAATRMLIETGKLRRCQVSSRAPRTISNPLFSVNYLDRELRKDTAEHVRESTRFARAAHTTMERIAVYLLYHNFFKPYRINQPVADRRVHATMAGISPGFIRWLNKHLTRQRIFLSRVPVPSPFLEVWLRTYQTPLSSRRPYLPRYAFG